MYIKEVSITHRILPCNQPGIWQYLHRSADDVSSARLFLGRLDDISTDGVELIQQIAEMFAVADIPTEIIAASVRHPMHVTACALAGADIATVPFKVIEQMTHHPLTDAGIAKFQADYKAVFGE